MLLKTESAASDRLQAETPLAVVEIGVLGAVIGALYLCALMYFTQTKGTDVASYAIFCGILPLFAAAVTVWAPQPAPELLTAGKIFLAIAMICVVVMALPLTLPLPAASPGLVKAVPVAAGVLVAVAYGVFLKLPSMQSIRRRFVTEVLANAALLAGLALLLVLFSPLDPTAPGGSTMLFYIAGAGWRRFGLWVVAGLAFIAVILLLYRAEAALSGKSRKIVAGVGLSLAVLLTLTLYDDTHFVDLTHYQPYVGPALQAKFGGIPMVDVYCQYGLLPWVLIAASYAVLPATVGTAAIVVRIVDVGYLLIFVLLAFTLTRRRFTAMILMVPMLIAGDMFQPGLYDVAESFNIHATPSELGMRYLPTAIMALVLAFDLRHRVVQFAGVVALVLASFWGLEAFMFTLATWGGTLFVEGVRSRSARFTLVQAVVGLATVLCAHLAFVPTVLMITGRMVNYLPYFDLLESLLAFKQNEVVGKLPWSNPIDYHLVWWIPIWIAYFLGFALAAVAALRGEPRGTAARALALCLFGITTLTYFVSRSSTTALGLSFLPFAVLVVVAFETLVANPHRFGTTGAWAFGFVAALLSLIFAFGFERFARPVSPIFSNSSILRHCFSKDGCQPSRVAARIDIATRMTLDKNYMAVLWNSNAPLYVDDVLRLLRTYVPEQKLVAILPDNWHNYAGYAVLSTNNQWYKWPIGSVVAEQQSAMNSNRILAAVTMRDGEILIVAQPESGLLLLEKRILEKLNAECRFTVVERTVFNAVYRAETCGSNASR